MSLEFMFIQIISLVSVLWRHLVKKRFLYSNFSWLLRSGSRPSLLTGHNTNKRAFFISKLSTPNYKVCPSHKFDPAREIK